jgi:hypothetical protein
MRSLRCLETSGIDYPGTRRHIPEERNLQLLAAFDDVVYLLSIT